MLRRLAWKRRTLLVLCTVAICFSGPAKIARMMMMINTYMRRCTRKSVLQFSIVAMFVITMTIFFMMGQLRAPDHHTMNQFAGARDSPPLSNSDDRNQPLQYGPKMPIIDTPNRDEYSSEKNITSLHIEEAINYEASNYKPEQVPQTIEYCNSPSVPVSGSEGEAPVGYQLKMTHVFIRHGDRSPMQTMNGFTPPTYSCLFQDKFSQITDPKVAAYIQTMEKFTGKQNKKSYFLNWALMPNKEECGDTELTGLGAFQHLLVGLHFHDKYILNLPFFDDNLALSSQIYIRSTERSRTYQSAVALLYGMLPPLAFNITNLNIDHSSNIFFCLPEHSSAKTCYCKQATGLGYKINSLESNANKNSLRFNEIADEISEIFEQTPAQVPAISALIDMFVPPLCHGQAIPCADWSNTRCLNGDIYYNLWLEHDYQGRVHLTDDTQSYSKFSNIMLTPLMVEIAHRMKDTLEGRSKPKFILYSGHDTTISPLLYILGIYDGKWTRYAARVVIELYVSDFKESKNNHMLKFLYNGNDVTENVSFCKGKLFKGMCHFKLFYEHVFTRMLQQFGYTSYDEACSRVK